MPSDRDDAGLDDKTDVRTPGHDIASSETAHLLRALQRMCEFEFGHLRLSFKTMYERMSDRVVDVEELAKVTERKVTSHGSQIADHAQRMSRIEEDFVATKRAITEQLEGLEARIAAMKPAI